MNIQRNMKKQVMPNKFEWFNLIGQIDFNKVDENSIELSKYINFSEMNYSETICMFASVLADMFKDEKEKYDFARQLIDTIWTVKQNVELESVDFLKK